MSNSETFVKRWHSQELRKELESLKEMLQVQGTSDEQKMYHQQLQGLQETKTLCKQITRH